MLVFPAETSMRRSGNILFAQACILDGVCQMSKSIWKMHYYYMWYQWVFNNQNEYISFYFISSF